MQSWMLAFIIPLIIAGVFFLLYILAPIVWKVLAKKLNATYEPGDDVLVAEPRPGQDQDDTPYVLVNDDDGSYSISFGNGRNLAEGGLVVTENGKSFTAGCGSDIPCGEQGYIIEGSLELLSTDREDGVITKLGSASLNRATWKIPGTGTKVITSILSLKGAPFVQFIIEFPSGVEGTSTGRRDHPCCIFPAFKLDAPNRRVFGFKVQVFAPPIKDLANTSTQGPVVLYDNQLNSLVFGPMDRFMVGRTGLFQPNQEEGMDDKDTSNVMHDVSKTPVLFHGIEGQVKEIPAGYQQSSILMLSTGINQALVDWGELLQQVHGVPPRDPLDDVATATLGYWTDNGAYYYYRTEKGVNYEETLLEAKNTFDKKDIPFRYLQLDSWWYKKLPKKSWTKPPKKWFAPLVKGLAKGGADTWTPKEEHFPNGLRQFKDKLGLPLAAHARWFAPDSSYANDYQVYKCDFGILPIEKRFWDDIMASAKEMGIFHYEQDWITTMFNGIPLLRENINAGENLLTWMGEAAASHGLTIQYCMAPPGAFLQALKLPAVTNARTGGDYWARAPKEFYITDITQANMLCWAIGIWPSYDVFYSKTTSIFTHQFLYREKYPRFMALLSVLGGGLVCPGDRPKYLDANLIGRTCSHDGELLKPDRPITPNDLMFRIHQKPYIMDTWTVIGDWTWRYVVSVSFWPRKVKDASVTLAQMGYCDQEGILYDFQAGTMQPVKPSTGISLPKRYMNYRYLIFAPYLIDGVALVGCINKFIPMARNLVSDVSLDGEKLMFSIKLLPGESLDILLHAKMRPIKILVSSENFTNWKYDASLSRLELHLDGRGGSEKGLVEIHWDSRAPAT
ncbi:hypothetical protein GF325_17490 [Candidatus Bathyarchaeota archaeon]|nr:hypothetical protein [Candidatus Bathyarchaeota archaeon]